MKYKLLDLFAGAGGLSLGFEETNLFSVVAFVENNKNAAQTYLMNHDGTKNYDDILNVDFQQMKEETGKIDVVIGGPPCQGFSNANRQRRQLINGSNELVKKYVKAIGEIQPDVFVMENVKTIASDKHSFCITNAEEAYIERELGLETHEKTLLLYEGDRAEEVFDLYNSNSRNIDRLTLLSEEQLYVLYNVWKKRDRVDQYLNKSVNIRHVRELIKVMVVQHDLPDWYNTCLDSARQVLVQLLDGGSLEKSHSFNDLIAFWNIQRFYQGILELNTKDARYEVILGNQGISVRMKTYIVIDYIRNAFSKLGYVTNEGILNAASFGVPQLRERFILIGVKKEFRNLEKDEIQLPKPILENHNQFITVSEAIADLQEYQPSTGTMDADIELNVVPIIDTFFKKMVMSSEDKYIYNHVCTSTRAKALERFKQIEKGKNFHSLPMELKDSYENPSRTQNTIYRRLDPTKPSDTVVNVRKSMWIHPNLNRAVSAREAARLQSFPDSYKFYGTKDSVYQQIGNAVPPVLGRAVAETVLELLGNHDTYETLKSIYDETVE